MEKLIVSSHNKKKIAELKEILEAHGFEPVSRDDAGLPDFEIEEDGQTFEENSYKKALEIMKVSGKPTIADDSGLMIDFLNGEPGVYSARYSGEDGNDLANNLKVLDKL